MVYPGDMEVKSTASLAPPIKAPDQWWGARHTFGLMATSGLAINYILRTSFSVAIVSMVGTRSDNSTQNISDTCPLPDDSGSSQQYTHGDFDWDEVTQGLILGSFYYGYAIVNVPVGRAAEVVGGRLTFGAGIVIACLLTLLVPLCADFSTGLLIGNRVLQGLALGGSLPSINTLLTSWYPPSERSKYTTIILAGMHIGTVISMPLTGWLCGTGWLGGWPLPFYVMGSIGLLWSLIWFLTVHNSPQSHPTITEEELNFILSEPESMTQQNNFHVPWLDIIRSPWVWVVIVNYIGDGYGFYILLTMLPSYFANIQHYDINNTGMLSALPYLVSWIVCMAWGFFVGYLSTSRLLSVKRIRQLSASVAYYIPALSLAGMCFIGCNPTLAVIVLCVAVGASGTNFAGYLSCNQDLAPNFAGTLTGISNTFGSLMGFASPIIAGFILNDNQTLSGWRVVFLSTVVLYVAVSILFLVFTPATVQPWNTPAKSTTNTNSNQH